MQAQCIAPRRADQASAFQLVQGDGDALPADSEAELRLRGDDVFGRKISISYFRNQTAEEAEFETRYAAAYKEAREKELARLQQELGMVCYAPRRGKLRIVA
jgi:hypothetical protein